MFCGMISCERKRPYFQEAVATFLADDSAPMLHLFLDADDAEYLGAVAGAPGVVVQKGRCPGPSPSARCVQNTAKVFQAAADANDSLLFLEDDSKLCKRWVNQLKLAVNEAREAEGKKFMLALFSAVSPKAPAHKYTAPYHPSDYYGMVACYFPSAIVPMFSYICAREVTKSNPLASDMLVKRALWDRRIPICMTNPSLSDHMGDFSHINGHERIIRAPSWKN